ncbi:MAG: homoserine dehydrogenase [Candidatus Tyrphobacter sp.]
MQLTVGIALLGCGTVGTAAAQRLVENAGVIERRTGVRCDLRGIAIRNPLRPRSASIPPHRFRRDAAALIADPRVDVVIETIGGTGDAAEYVERALDAGRHVITSNKELVATQGPRLLALAASRGVTLRYEAAACSAVPVVRTILDALAGDVVHSVGGVLNGTTTFILSAMEEGARYDDALAAAQHFGYAEADPAYDVDGADAAHKLALLLQVAFESAIISSRIRRSGIAGISRDHIRAARAEGFRIRLVAAGVHHNDGILAEVGPVLVPEHHAFANVRAVENAVRIEARDAGTLSLSGLGAGGVASASAILGDLTSLLRDLTHRRQGGASHAPRFDPIIDVAPAFAYLERSDDLGGLPIWNDALLNATASLHDSAGPRKDLAL